MNEALSPRLSTNAPACCSETSKPVMEFDQFMAIPPCTTGKHTDEKPAPAAAPEGEKDAAPAATSVAGGVETYGSTPAASAPSSIPASMVPSSAPTPPPAPELVEEDDDLSLPVPDGAKCKRLGCGAVWQGEAVSRGDGAEALCTYHPQAVSVVPASGLLRLASLTPARVPRRLKGLPLLQAARARV